MSTTFLVASTPSFKKQTEVCLNSIRRHHPEARIEHVLLSNEYFGIYPSGIFYKRLERCKQLLEEAPSSNIVMLGADCVLYDKIWSFIQGPGDIILVPHVVRPPADNGKFYKTGHINSDVSVWRRNSLPALSWMLTQTMDGATEEGRFYDQTLFSSIPFLFDLDIRVCRDQAINWAYFNLSERRNVTPKLVQYSGFRPENPAAISKYYDGELPPVSQLEYFLDYGARLNDS